jgi:hypothetical protein
VTAWVTVSAWVTASVWEKELESGAGWATAWVRGWASASGEE